MRNWFWCLTSPRVVNFSFQFGGQMKEKWNNYVHAGRKMEYVSSRIKVKYYSISVPVPRTHTILSCCFQKHSRFDVKWKPSHLQGIITQQVFLLRRLFCRICWCAWCASTLSTTWWSVFASGCSGTHTNTETNCDDETKFQTPNK